MARAKQQRVVSERFYKLLKTFTKTLTMSLLEFTKVIDGDCDDDGDLRGGGCIVRQIHGQWHHQRGARAIYEQKRQESATTNSKASEAVAAEYGCDGDDKDLE